MTSQVFENAAQDNNNNAKVAFLPPINVQPTPEADDRRATSEQSGNNRMLYVPDTTPDLRYESGEFQRRLSVDKTTPIHVTYKKPPLPQGARSKPTNHSKREKVPDAKPLRYVNKYSNLYNSWEVGLHNYRIQDDSNDDSDQLTYRFKMRQDDDDTTVQAKRPKTPPKDPFKESILADIERRRVAKLQQAAELSAAGDLIKGQPVVEEPPTSAELRHRQRGSHGFHRVRQLHHADDYRDITREHTGAVVFTDGTDRGSGLFQRKSDVAAEQKLKRPFDEQQQSAHNTRLLTGRTVLRNPLSPVPLKHRYNPVVVMKSKLDDYTGAIKQFLEQVVEEQRMSAYKKQPLPLAQTVDNMVIYQDFDTIQYFKAMKKQLQQSQQHTNELTKAQQYNFKAPASNVARGVAKVQKLGSLVALDDLEPLPRSGLKPRGLQVPRPQQQLSQSVFLTNPHDVSDLTSEQAGLQQQMMMFSAGMGTPTTAPPNTPHVGSARM